MKVWWLRLVHYAKPHTASFGVDAAHDLRSGLSDADALAHETHCRLRADKSAVAAKRCVDQRFARRRLTAWPTGMVSQQYDLFVSDTTDGWHRAELCSTRSRISHDIRPWGDLFHHLQYLSVRPRGRHRAGDLVRRVMNDSGC